MNGDDRTLDQLTHQITTGSKQERQDAKQELCDRFPNLTEYEVEKVASTLLSEFDGSHPSANEVVTVLSVYGRRCDELLAEEIDVDELTEIEDESHSAEEAVRVLWFVSNEDPYKIHAAETFLEQYDERDDEVGKLATELLKILDMKEKLCS